MVASMPELFAFGGVSGGAETERAHFVANLFDHFQTGGEGTFLRGVKFHEEGGMVGEVDSFGIAEHFGVGGVDEFKGGGIEAAATNGDDGFDGGLDGGK